MKYIKKLNKRNFLLSLVVLSIILVPVAAVYAYSIEYYYQRYDPDPEYIGDGCTSIPFYQSKDNVVKIKYNVESTGGQGAKVYVYVTAEADIVYTRLCDEGYESAWVTIPDGKDDVLVHFSADPIYVPEYNPPVWLEATVTHWSGD